MTESLLMMAKDLTIAQIHAGHLTLEDLESVLHTTYTTLQHLRAAEQGLPVDVACDRATAWKKSITNRTVTCLECGATFKQLSVRHLRLHEMNGRSYRAKYGIPHTQSLSARDVLKRRREILQRSRPWERKGSKTQQKQLKRAS